MSWYAVLCEKCGFADSDYDLPMSEANWPVKCPSCKKKKLQRDWSAPPEYIIRDNTPKTVGQQAERNNKAMGREMEQRTAEQILGPVTMAKRNAPTPWWREPGEKPLNLDKVKDVAHYIETGETS